MSPVSIVLSVAAILVAVILFRLFSSRRFPRETRTPISELDQREKALEEKFYASLRNGDKARNLARVYSQMDLALLKSILSSMEIAFFVSNQNMNNLRTGVAVQGFNDTILVVLDSDYTSARDIVADYIINRKQSASRATAATKFRNIAETALSGLFMNPNDKLPELLE